MSQQRIFWKLTSFLFVISSVSLQRTSAASTPNYGRFAGLLNEEASKEKPLRYNCQGFVWIPNENQIVISDFNFIPPQRKENNVTFWIGPSKITGSVNDSEPSNNGIYLKPVHLKKRALHSTKSIVQYAKKPKSPSETVLQEILAISKIPKDKVSTAEYTAFTPSYENNIEQTDTEENSEAIEIVKVEKGTLKTLKITNPPPVHSSIVEASVQVKELSKRKKRDFDVNDIWKAVFKLVDKGEQYQMMRQMKSRNNNHNKNKEEVAQTDIDSLPLFKKKELLLLNLPADKTIWDFSWLSVYDHHAEKSIATVYFPKGPSWLVPKSKTLPGFREYYQKYSVTSSNIEILDEKTLLFHNFSCQECPPGTWIMAGDAMLPNLAGEILPTVNENGTYACDYLPDKLKNVTIKVKLPGLWEVSDLTWISVFNVPHKFSLSEVYVSHQDNVPPVFNDDPKTAWLNCDKFINIGKRTDKISLPLPEIAFPRAAYSSCMSSISNIGEGFLKEIIKRMFEIKKSYKVIKSNIIFKVLKYNKFITYISPCIFYDSLLCSIIAIAFFIKLLIKTLLQLHFLHSQLHFAAVYFAFYCRICFLQHVISNNKSNLVKKRDFEECNRNNIKHGQGLLTFYAGLFFSPFQQQLSCSILPVAAELTDIAPTPPPPPSFSIVLFGKQSVALKNQCIQLGGTLFYADCVYAASLVPNWWKLAGPRLSTSIAVLGIAPLRFTTRPAIISAVTVSLLYSLFPQSQLNQPVHFTATLFS
ncbi:hypothetical protein T4D_10190 [Trichinella pseudospiralis]|uniref:DM13 domain-containing protein n=1 Tax=Trichinella pseudospiralis TaxID=6337 RepID=A0A0V1FZ70_TRIPS|nr:hypothetical protein T4D_10190 [Trichinella pseudospiralis]